MNIAVIIPAAGRSTRFGDADKLAQDIGGRAMLIRSIEPFTRHEAVRTIIVGGPADPDELASFRDRYGPTLGFHGARIVAGGRTARWETVQRALAEVPDDATHVAVHDAARPNLSAALLSRVIDAARRFDAVIPAVPISATVKRLDERAADARADEEDVIADAILGDAGREVTVARRVVETIDRANVVAVQTPQIFAADLLRRAYAAGSAEGATDDASVVERLGEPVFAIAGEVGNVKVTTAEDLDLVRALMRSGAASAR